MKTAISTSLAAGALALAFFPARASAQDGRAEAKAAGQRADFVFPLSRPPAFSLPRPLTPAPALPAAPATLEIAGREGNRLTLRWAPGSPPGGSGAIRYAVFRNGTEIAECEEAQCVVSFDPAGERLEVFSVRAIDAQGRSSLLSRPVTAPRGEPVTVRLETKIVFGERKKQGFAGLLDPSTIFRHAAYGGHIVTTYADFSPSPGAILGVRPGVTEIDYSYSADFDGDIEDLAGEGRVVRSGYFSGVLIEHEETALPSTAAEAHVAADGSKVIDVPFSIFEIGARSMPRLPGMSNDHFLALSAPGDEEAGSVRREELAYSGEFTDSELDAGALADLEQAREQRPILEWGEGYGVSYGQGDYGLPFSAQSIAQRGVGTDHPHAAQLFSEGEYRFTVGGPSVAPPGPPLPGVSLPAGPPALGDSVRLRWAERFEPADGGTSRVLAVREEDVPLTSGSGAGLSHFLSVPEEAGVVTPVLLPVFPEIVARPTQASAFSPYVPDTLMAGQTATLELLDQTNLQHVTSGAFHSITLAVGAENVVRLLAIDPSIEETQGLEAAIAQADLIPDGVNLLDYVTRSGLEYGEWKLVALGLASGSVEISVRFDDSPLAVLTRTLNVLPTIQFAADANRDGAIDLTGDSDGTSLEQPYRFWLNDDDDAWVDSSQTGLYSEEEQDDRDVRVTNEANWQDNKINGTRDLEDLARLCLRLPGARKAVENHELQVGLKWTDVEEGFPVIRIFRAVEEDGGLRYLTDPTTAELQASNPEYYAVLEAGDSGTESRLIAPGKIFCLPNFLFWDRSGAYTDTAHLLFEGCQAGTGRLVAVLLNKKGEEIGEGPGLWLDLKEPREFVERWSCGDDDLGEVLPVARVNSKSGPFALPATEEDRDYLLYVHGYNMQEFEKQTWLETTYKRLWQLGYKGRVGGFSWPCAQSALPYDRSEERAWQSAAQLRTLLAALKTAGYRVHVLGHSQGNVAVGEALRQWKELGHEDPLVQTYIASQAAIEAHCYDPGAPLILGFENSLTDTQTPNVYLRYPTTEAPYLAPAAMNGAAVKFWNFENPDDYALTGNSLSFPVHPGWQLDQRLKPGVGFGYDPIGSVFFEAGLGTLRSLHLPVNRFRVFSYAAEGRSVALGSAQVAGVFLQGDYELRKELKYGSEHLWHSAQFRSAMAERYRYWLKVLNIVSPRDSTP